jgi:predicted transposase/invertase (TIGR01784 family)
MQKHDNAYKHFFSHPLPVRDLLKDFVHEDWVQQMDFDTLEKMNSSYVTDELRDRESDIVWRIRRKDPHTGEPGAWLYVYLLLEFQSTVDAYMAVRVLAYVALLYQDLIKSKQLQNGKLPAVFPLVLYNGKRPWNAARAVEDLIEDGPDTLAAYRPRLKYFLLDEGRVPESELSEDNAVSLVISLEGSRTPEQIYQNIGPMIEFLKRPGNAELSDAMTLLAAEMIPEHLAQDKGVMVAVKDLKGVRTVLAENMEAWAEGQRQVANQQGMQQGMQQGVGLSLKRILARRFKTALPNELDERINAANVEQIEMWIDRCLDAPDLNGVFEH